jgi:16S rRNA G966 N2-methylase RsmD
MVCESWKYVPSDDECSGYESVISELRTLNSEQWKQSNQTEQQQIQDRIFAIYRSINLVPITYYTLDGCRQQIQHLCKKSASVVDHVIQSSNLGQSLCRFWFPNQDQAYTYHDRQIGLSHRFYNDVKLRRAIEICLKYKRSVMPADVKSALGLVSGNLIQNFKPMSARAIYEYCCPIYNGRILDFSSGYGGRMLGAMTSPMRYHYTGIEPNTLTYQALCAFGDLIRDTSGAEYQMNHTVSEEYVGDRNSIDFAFSSPPYFNLEIYSDESTQCMHRYQTLNQWFQSYVEPTIKMLHFCLRDDALYAVNINDYTIEKKLYNIVNPWLALSEKCGFQHVDTIHMRLAQRPGNSLTNQRYKQESVYIFKKVNNAKQHII